MAKSRRLAGWRRRAFSSALVTINGNRPRSATIVLAWSAEPASTRPATIAPSARAARYRYDVMDVRTSRHDSRLPLRGHAGAAAGPESRRPSPATRAVPRTSWFPPRRALPGRDIRILAAPARLAITSEGEQVVALGIRVPGALVDVGPAPRIDWDGLPQVGSPPVARLRLALRRCAQRIEALRARRVVVVIEPIRFEREAEQLDLRASGGPLGVADVAEHHRGD